VRTNQPSAFQKWFDAHNDPTDPTTFFADAKHGSNTNYAYSTAFNNNMGCEYGLVSLLWKRKMGDGQSHYYDKDGDRDSAFKDRIATFLKDINLAGGVQAMVADPSMGLTGGWTNGTKTINDPWGGEYKYECPSPYFSFRLYSCGPDRAPGTGDDVACGSWNE
jgi:hypothetical protein